MQLESNKTYTIVTNIEHGRGINGVNFDIFNKVKVIGDDGQYLELFDTDNLTVMHIRWDSILSVREYPSVNVYRIKYDSVPDMSTGMYCKRISVEKYNTDEASIAIAKKLGIPLFETEEEGEKYMHKHIPEGFHEVDYNYHFLYANEEA